MNQKNFFGCEFAELQVTPTINSTHTSKLGNCGICPESEEEKVTCVRRARFLKVCAWKEYAYVIFSFFSAGIFWLVLYWYPYLLAKTRFSEVNEDTYQANFVLIEGIDGQAEIVGMKTVFRKSGDEWEIQENTMSACGGSVASRLSPKSPTTTQSPEEPGLVVLYMVEWRHVRLWYNPSTNAWHQLMFGPSRGSFERLHSVGFKSAGHSTVSTAGRQITYGKNTIQVQIQKIAVLLLEGALSPFVVFQVYSVAVWMVEEYILYSVVLIILTFTTIVYSAFQTQKAQKGLRSLARSEGIVLQAKFKEDRWNTTQVLSSELVPGDLIEVTNCLICPCDLVLLSGQCIVNEAMLTGESAPIIKEPLPLEGADFNPHTNRAMKHLLLSGSEIIQAKPSAPPPQALQSNHSNDAHTVWDFAITETPVLAMVLQTGSETAKGKLIQTIEYPQDSRGFAHRQKEEAEQFMFFLIAVTIIACVWFIIYMNALGFLGKKIVQKTFDLTTMLVPAALPLVLSVGVAFAFESLKKKSIFASSTTHIVTAGHVDCICYDKTGTLTTEGDTFVGVHTVSHSPIPSFQPLTRTVQELPSDSIFHFMLAACHSLTYLVQEGHETGELIGEQLEQEMFKASGWRYHEISKEIDKQIVTVFGVEVPSHCTMTFLPPFGASTFLATLRIFPFDAELRTMSSIVLVCNKLNQPSQKTYLLVKGAPESIGEKCNVHSRPPDYHTFMEKLAQEGYRILGCAFKELTHNTPEVQKLSRAQLEMDLTFCGFLLMGNQLKPETKKVLRQIEQAKLRQCMVTGDNILTAISVAKQCGTSFIAKEPIFVLDSPAYHHNALNHPSLDSFTLSSLGTDDSRSGSSLHTQTEPHFNSFEELLASVQIHGGEGYFSLAVTGNAFSALVDINDDLRPDDFSDAPSQKSFKSAMANFFRGPRTKSNIYSSLVGKYGGVMPSSPLESVLSVANVYARCKPHEKQMLMSMLQKHAGHYVCMVGDGANDSFALKTADVGLSICSNAASSTASGTANQGTSAPSIAAPFSTPINHIGALLDLLTEGRAALASSIIAFRYMVSYGVICFSQVIILFARSKEFGDTMWMWGDLFLNLPIALVLNMTKCSDKLAQGTPETAIKSPRFAAAFAVHVVILVLTQVMVISYAQRQSWFIQYSDSKISMEVSLLFWTSSAQYITSAMYLSHDYAGFRGHWWTNKALVTVLIYAILSQSAIILCNKAKWTQKLFGTVDFPSFLGWAFILFMVLSCLVHVFFECLLPHRAKPKVKKQGGVPSHLSSFKTKTAGIRVKHKTELQREEVEMSIRVPEAGIDMV